MSKYHVINCHDVNDKVINEARKYDEVAINPDYKSEKLRLETMQEFIDKMDGYKLFKIDKDGWRLLYVLKKIDKEEEIQN